MGNIEQELYTGDRRQVIIFQLGEEEYGVNINQSKEIIKISKITNVPNTPDYVCGVINLRGQIVPVIDLRKRLGIEGSLKTEKRRIITVEVRDSLIGLIVDGANEVVWLDTDELEPAPEIEGGIKQEFIEGIGKYDGRLLVLINLERLLFYNNDIDKAEIVL